MSQRERMLAIVLGGLLLTGLLWLALTFDWSQQGGQFRELGTEMGNRRGGAVRTAEYAYVANSRTKQYWPNEAQYAARIPARDRVFILDAAALRKFHGYTAGPP